MRLSPMTGMSEPLRAGRIVVAMTLFTLFGQILALGRESAIAAMFGASNLTDAFLLAIMIPNAFLLLVQNGLLMAFIPMVGEILIADDKEQARRTIDNLVTSIMLLLILTIAVLVLGADYFVSILVPTLSSTEHALIVQMLRPLTLITILGGGASLLTGIANVNRRFIAPALFGLIMNGTIILGIVFWGKALSIHILVISTIVAYAIQTVLLSWVLRPLYRYRPAMDLADPKLRALFALAWPAIVTLFLQQIVVFSDRAIAARFGSGSVAALNFASRLVFALPPLLIGALSSVVLPELSRSTASGDWDEARKLATSTYRYSVFLITPVAALLFILRKPIIILAFEHGAFSSSDTNLTQGPMGFYTITLLAICLRELIVRFFYAAQDTMTPLLSGILRTGINLTLNIVLSHFMGIAGIALANAVAILVDVLLLRTILCRKWHVPSNLVFSLKVSVALLPLFLTAPLLYRTAAASTFVSNWAFAACQIAIGAVAGSAGYWVAAWLLNISESRSILIMAGRQLRTVGVRLVSWV
jgi:putative peptidoglycan lipid II flippase